MAWLKIDDGRADHPKVRRLVSHGAAGFRAYFDLDVLMSWCARGRLKEVDRRIHGHIPDYIPASLGVTRRSVTLLAECGLLDAQDDGWAIHDWSEFQRPDETAAARKRKQRQRNANEAADHA